MTRNTKLYRSKIKDKNGKEIEIIYRDLTVNELSFINNIKSEDKKREYACKFALEGNYNLQWPAIIQVGEIIILKSRSVSEDRDLFELTVKDFRESIPQDSVLSLIGHICRVFPGTSVTDLLNLTYKDLIELVCLCEIATNKKIFDVQSIIGNVKRNGKTEFPDDGKSLKEKMDELKKFNS